ncbi:type VI secretion system tube protein Hcp [Pleionea sediminis]|uniref:type VI secretion system tube protein Hcp n=1 Tax=Pleionea sediminis TaxID=2569479 RepID=UPI001185CB1A|nr:type VI secretion system tube protein Hcp [Pleionea sediminis]
MKTLKLIFIYQCLVWCTPLFAYDRPVIAYLYLETENFDISRYGEGYQNRIGDVDVSRDIEVLSFEWGFNTSETAHSYPVRSPLVINKEIDGSSPILVQALLENRMVEGTLKLFRANYETGRMELFYTFRMTNARISDVSVKTMARNEGNDLVAVESVSITYGQLEMESNRGTVVTHGR